MYKMMALISACCTLAQHHILVFYSPLGHKKYNNNMTMWIVCRFLFVLESDPVHILVTCRSCMLSFCALFFLLWCKHYACFIFLPVFTHISTISAYNALICLQMLTEPEIITKLLGSRSALFTQSQNIFSWFYFCFLGAKWFHHDFSK